MLALERERFTDEAFGERAITQAEVREPAKQSVLGALFGRKVGGLGFELPK